MKKTITLPDEVAEHFNWAPGAPALFAHSAFGEKDLNAETLTKDQADKLHAEGCEYLVPVKQKASGKQNPDPKENETK